MTSFSEKYASRPKVTLQIESMNDDLRNSIWTQIKNLFNELLTSTYWNILMSSYWEDFFKLPSDKFDSFLPGKKIDEIRNKFYRVEWFRVYDFIEFTLRMLKIINLTTEVDFFRKGCNILFERENAPYRLVDTAVIRLTSKVDITAIENAIEVEDESSKHISSALNLLSDKTSKKYRESCHQSISAVEAIARKVDGTKKTLSQLCDALPIHEAFRMGLKKIYAYTSDDGGIRHSITANDRGVDYEDALFMLIMCSAFVNYIRVKAKPLNTHLKNPEFV